MRQIAQLVQVLLPLPDVPMQALGQGIEPIGDLIGRADTRYRIDRRCYPQTVAVEEFLSVSTVERDPRRVSAVRRYGDLEFNASRDDDRPKRQGMRADRCDHDGRYRRMNHTRSGCYRVGGRAGRRADDQAVTLDAGHVLAVDKEVDVR